MIADLKDIRLTVEPGFWPLAWGWWVLLGLLTLLIVMGIIGLIRKRKFQVIWEWKRWEKTRPENQGALANQWLKQAALLTMPRKDIARFTGEEWIGFLDQRGVSLNSAMREWLSQGYLEGITPPDDALAIIKEAILVLSKGRVQ